MFQEILFGSFDYMRAELEVTLDDTSAIVSEVTAERDAARERSTVLEAEATHLRGSLHTTETELEQCLTSKAALEQRIGTLDDTRQTQLSELEELRSSNKRMGETLSQADREVARLGGEAAVLATAKLGLDAQVGR